jgi:hypothetical protein
MSAVTIMSAPGVPFHRLARTAKHRWWRPVTGTVTLLVLGLVAICAVYAAPDAVVMIANGSSGAELFVVDAPLLLAYAAAIAWLARRRHLVTLAPAVEPQATATEPQAAGSQATESRTTEPQAGVAVAGLAPAGAAPVDPDGPEATEALRLPG